MWRRQPASRTCDAAAQGCEQYEAVSGGPIMFVAPGTVPDLGRNLSRQAAQRVAANWWRLLVNGLALIVAGVLIFSINWSIRSLATFIGALFIFQGVTYALTTGIDA